MEKDLGRMFERLTQHLDPTIASLALGKAMEEAIRLNREIDTLHNRISIEHDVPLAWAEAIVTQARGIVPSFKKGLTEMDMAVIISTLHESWGLIAHAAGLSEPRVHAAVRDAVDRVAGHVDMIVEAGAKFRDRMKSNDPRRAYYRGESLLVDRESGARSTIVTEVEGQPVYEDDEEITFKVVRVVAQSGAPDGMREEHRDELYGAAAGNGFAMPKGRMAEFEAKGRFRWLPSAEARP